MGQTLLIIALAICAVIMLVGYDGLIAIVKGKRRNGKDKTEHKVK